MTIGILRRCLPATVLILVFLGATARAIEVKRVVSPTGLEAWLVEDHTNPIVAVRFAFRGGAALDPTGKEGLADVVSSLLDEGAGELDSQAFQRRLEDMAITLRFDAGYETFGGRLTTLSVNVGAAFDLLRLALTQPRFDDEPVARIRSQILTMIRRNSEDPDVIAGRTLRRALFPDHPYGRPVMGTEDSVKAITAADLKVFTAERLARDNLVIGVVGDMTPDRLAALLDGTFGGLPGQAAPWRLPEVAPIATGRTIVVKKAVPQSAILFAQAGVKRDDKDFYPAYIMNYILGGGGFTSRLYNEVREKRGLAYSVYTALSPHGVVGPSPGRRRHRQRTGRRDLGRGPRRMAALGRRRRRKGGTGRHQDLPYRIVPAPLFVQRTHRRHLGGHATRHPRHRLSGPPQQLRRGGDPGRRQPGGAPASRPRRFDHCRRRRARGSRQLTALTAGH